MSAPPPRAPGLAARRAALAILDAVLRSGQTTEAAARHAAALPAPDRSLALAIAGETLRRLPELDALIDGATRQRLPEDAKARMVLRLALAQKLKLNVPDHAIVATALPLVDGGPRRLVHGVLGTLLRRGPVASETPSLPPGVEERWGAAWSEAAVAAARRQIAARPMLDLSFAADAEAQAFAAARNAASLAPCHVRIPSSRVDELDGFAAGRWWVQDLAASLPARLIPAEAGDVVDLCAAPGGKTMQLAAAGHRVTAVDSSAERLDRLAANLERTQLAATLVAADARAWTPAVPADAVLLDAPCSATGTFRRHPEVLHRVRPRFIAEAAERQHILLTRAAAMVRPGGVLVYAVCSLEPEEGERAIERFLGATPGFTLDPPKAGELPDFVPVGSDGWVRLLPGLLEDAGGLDGFFMARLVRAG